MNDPYDYLFKFLVIGSAGTGKSCLLHQFIENRFKEESSHTIGKHLLAPQSLFLPQFQSVFRIHDILVRIRILLFSSLTFKRPTKT
jgi:hypothetical protein